MAWAISGRHSWWLVMPMKRVIILLARVEQGLQSAVGRFDLLQIICLAQAVNVQQIDLIHLEALRLPSRRRMKSS